MDETSAAIHRKKRLVRANQPTRELILHRVDARRVLLAAVCVLSAVVATHEDARSEEVSDHNSSAIHASFVSKFKRFCKEESYWGDAVNQWHATAWKGDRVHRQLVLWSDTTVSGLSCQIDNLRDAEGAIPSSNIQIRKLQYVKGDQVPYSCKAVHDPFVWVADALSEVPIKRLTENTRYSLWVTITIPAETSHGTYHGQIRITGDNVTSAVLEVTVDVLDLRLPDVADWTFHLDLWQFPAGVLESYNKAVGQDRQIEFWSERHLAMLEPFYRRLADAGQKTITTYIKGGAAGAPSMVRHIRDEDGKTWHYDYSDFDRYVERLNSWGITEQISAFSLVGWNKGDLLYWDESLSAEVTAKMPLTSDAYQRVWTRFLNDFRDHLKQKGWFEKTVLFMDEVPNEEMQAVIDLIKSHDRQWKIGLAYGHFPSDEILAQLYDASGILGTVSQDDAPNPPRRIRTFYTSCTQTIPNSYVTPQNSPAEMTWMAWHAAAQGYDGYLRWAYDYWRLEDPLDIRDGGFTAGDFALVYRTSNDELMQCMSSVRFELLREGIQDFEKIGCLKCEYRSELSQADRSLLESQLQAFTEQSGIQGKAELTISDAQALLSDISKNVSQRATRQTTK